MPAHLSPPELLLQATARARSLEGRVLVVKLGGSAMEDPAATRGTLQSVVALEDLGVQLVLVHGGGKPIDRAMAAAGLTPKKVAGRRYTDGATLEVVVRVLAELNAGIVQQLRELGGEAAGFATDPVGEGVGASDVIRGERLTWADEAGRPVDLGRVGKPVSVDVERLDGLWDIGHTPVIPSLARSLDDGGWLNVNADTAASAVAGALQAEACLFLTDTPGVLRDVRDPASLLSRLTRAECQRLVRDGVIAGGMVPKVEACFEALDAGAGRAVILDGRHPHALLNWFLSEPAGTEIVP
jgi:acetylglutamate kinase